MSKPGSVFITGSTRGIGLEIATSFVAAGWTVGIHGREPTAVDLVVAKLGPLASGYPLELSDSSSMTTALSTFSKSAGSLDCVVHCAGIMKDAPLGMISQELADEVIGTNVIATLQVVQLATRIMSRHKSGSIILFNSVVGLDGALGQVLYSTSKAALTGLVKSAARELGPKGIRINAIAPGLIQTDLIKGLDGALLENLRQSTPLGRLGETKDIAPLVMFLASDDSSFITAETIRVDGGFRP